MYPTPIPDTAVFTGFSVLFEFFWKLFVSFYTAVTSRFTPVASDPELGLQPASAVPQSPSRQSNTSSFHCEDVGSVEQRLLASKFTIRLAQT